MLGDGQEFGDFKLVMDADRKRDFIATIYGGTTNRICIDFKLDYWVFGRHRDYLTIT